MTYPLVIQGGMGVGISGWRLARSVSETGQLGVVSGTGIEAVFIRTLQKGDPGGYLKRALDHFPVPETAERIYKKYFSASLSDFEPFKNAGMVSAKLSKELQEILVVSNFCEVFLAKLDHLGEVGINFLEKIQMTTLPSPYGAILAGVDYVIMGAGIPREIPGALDGLSKQEDFSLVLNVAGATREDGFKTSFSPKKILGEIDIELKRPRFLAIVSSALLARTLAKKSNGKVDGFVIEAPSAGGHNAPPRGELTINERGEPVYGERDELDLEAIKKLQLPFWMAGSLASPDSLRWARAQGAEGVQVGTAFALCEESGLRADLKETLLKQVLGKKVDVFTDPKASPTGFPFKVAKLPGTLSDDEIYRDRPKKCDTGYLRQLYKKDDGSIGYRCAGEPGEIFLKKGGSADEITGRKCLCNALLSNLGLGQRGKNGYVEKPLVTIGDSVNEVSRFMPSGGLHYSAKNVINDLLTGTK